MKHIRNLATLLLTVAVLTVSAAAAVPSIGKEDVPPATGEDVGSPSVDDGVKSPQTGVSTAGIVLASVSFAGAGAAFVAKSRRED